MREASTFLGVSEQTVYLWLERKQIPHLRVMGRNIRFLRSERRLSRKSRSTDILLLGRQEIPEDRRQLFGETARFGDGF